MSTATKRLRTTAHKRQPVRLLRSSKSLGRYAPSEGIRYDGLYDILNMHVHINDYGARHLRFTLVRRQGQESVRSIAARSPTPLQLQRHAQIAQVNTTGWRTL